VFLFIINTAQFTYNKALILLVGSIPLAKHDKFTFSLNVSVCDNELVYYKYFTHNNLYCSSVLKGKKKCIVQKLFC